jgi:hypothetical protein
LCANSSTLPEQSSSRKAIYNTIHFLLSSKILLA